MCKNKAKYLFCIIMFSSASFAAQNPVSVTITTPLAAQTTFETATDTVYTFTNNSPYNIDDFSLIPSSHDGTYSNTGGSCTAALNSGQSCTWEGRFTPSRVDTGNAAKLTMRYGATPPFVLTQTTNTAAAPEDAFAYLSDAGSDQIWRCVINTDTDALEDCENANATGIDSPTNVTLIDNDTKAFIASTGNNLIIRCNIESQTGKFEDCSATRRADNCIGGNGLICSPYAVQIRNNIAYIYQGSTTGAINSVAQCEVDGDDNLENCSDVSDDVMTTPTATPPGFAINPAGTRIYGTTGTFIPGGQNNPAVSYANINQTTGNLENGTVVNRNTIDAGAGLGARFSSLAFNTTGTRIFVTMDDIDGIYSCQVNAGTGELGSCTKNNLGLADEGLGFFPTVAINSAGTKVFINAGTTGSSGTRVLRCDVVDATGVISNCEDAGNGGGATFSQLRGITLQASV